MSFVCNVARLLFSSSDAAQILIATKTLTNAQIKALAHPTPITVITAPGSGLQIQPISARIFSKTSSGAYTNIDAAGNLQLLLAGSVPAFSLIPNDAAITNGSATRLSDLLGTTTNKTAWLLPNVDTEDMNEDGPIPTVLTTSALTDQALTVQIDNGGSSDLLSGHSANTLTIIVFYAIVTVP